MSRKVFVWDAAKHCYIWWRKRRRRRVCGWGSVHLAFVRLIIMDKGSSQLLGTLHWIHLHTLPSVKKMCIGGRRGRKGSATGREIWGVSVDIFIFISIFIFIFIFVFIFSITKKCTAIVINWLYKSNLLCAGSQQHIDAYKDHKWMYSEVILSNTLGS